MVNISSALARAAACWPSATATVCQGRSASWSEVEAAVSRVRGALKARGLMAGGRMAILARNSDVYLHYIFAAAQLGATLVALNVQWSPKEVAHALNDSEVSICVVDADLAGLLAEALPLCKTLRLVIHVPGGGGGAGVVPSTPPAVGYGVRVCSHAEQQPSCSALLRDEGHDGSDPCTIMYTSGSGGAPKGVMLTHQGHVVQALEKVAQVGYGCGTRYLNCVPLYHVGGMSSLLAVTMCGGAHYFLQKFDPPAVLQALAQHEINTLVVVPTMVEMLLAHRGSGGAAFPKVLTLLVGGQSMWEDLIRRARTLFPNGTFIQTFACTEACSSITFSVISTPTEPLRASHSERAGLTQEGQSVACMPVGRPAHHAEVAVFGEEGERIPTGVVGRIATRGMHVMMGYLNRAEETAAALRGGWLFTGDVGFIDADGVLCFTSRVTDRINTGGEKVFGGEVEAVLLRHAAVRQAVVFGARHRTLGQAVTAAVILHASHAAGRDASTVVDSLAVHCREALSGYKVPKKIFAWPDASFPMTPSGKIMKSLVRQRYEETLAHTQHSRL